MLPLMFLLLRLLHNLMGQQTEEVSTNRIQQLGNKSDKIKASERTVGIVFCLFSFQYNVGWQMIQSWCQ
jgi:hypothetical protein